MFDNFNLKLQNVYTIKWKGHMDIWKYGNMDIWIYGYMDIWIYGYIFKNSIFAQLIPGPCLFLVIYLLVTL